MFEEEKKQIRKKISRYSTLSGVGIIFGLLQVADHFMDYRGLGFLSWNDFLVGGLGVWAAYSTFCYYTDLVRRAETELHELFDLEKKYEKEYKSSPNIRYCIDSTDRR